ncbi:MAG: XdhC family protein [Spongiibacteraceae bacterium]|jgi:xanthine dehydrogenase accessory factor|nr:XdhC family protein [Spongiibacteraceae bacterium]
MENLDQQVLHQLRDWLSGGLPVWLCTIVETRGASPRPVGALLACNGEGELVGSLSGGCIEDDLLERLVARELAADVPELYHYGLSAEENARLGLPCGGQLTVLIEPLHRAGAAAGQQAPAAHARVEQLTWLLTLLEQRRCVRREVDLDSGAWQLSEIDEVEPLLVTDARVRQDFGPRYTLLLIGAGALAQAVAELALRMDYRVLVNDPRPEWLARWPVAGVQCVAGMPDDAVRRYAADERSIVITLTHDPRIDDMALMEALTTRAFYVGALGSQRTSAKRVQRLRQLDLSDAQLARLHAPVGLAIGSKTPMEIAVAILAELTQLRRTVR